MAATSCYRICKTVWTSLLLLSLLMQCCRLAASQTTSNVDVTEGLVNLTKKEVEVLEAIGRNAKNLVNGFTVITKQYMQQLFRVDTVLQKALSCNSSEQLRPTVQYGLQSLRRIEKELRSRINDIILPADAYFTKNLPPYLFRRIVLGKLITSITDTAMTSAQFRNESMYGIAQVVGNIARSIVHSVSRSGETAMNAVAAVANSMAAHNRQKRGTNSTVKQPLDSIPPSLIDSKRLTCGLSKGDRIRDFATTSTLMACRVVPNLLTRKTGESIMQQCHVIGGLLASCAFQLEDPERLHFGWNYTCKNGEYLNVSVGMSHPVCSKEVERTATAIIASLKQTPPTKLSFADYVKIYAAPLLEATIHVLVEVVKEGTNYCQNRISH